MSEDEIPGSVQYAKQNGRNPAVALGMMLHHAIGIEKVGKQSGTRVLWRVRP
jgi:hypothetical protein